MWVVNAQAYIGLSAAIGVQNSIVKISDVPNIICIVFISSFERRNVCEKRELKCAENYNKWHNIFYTAFSILVISNRNNFQALFDEIVSVYFI